MLQPPGSRRPTFPARSSPPPARPARALYPPGKRSSSARWPAAHSAATSLRLCVLFPARSTPSSTMSAPRRPAMAASPPPSRAPKYRAVARSFHWLASAARARIGCYFPSLVGLARADEGGGARTAVRTASSGGVPAYRPEAGLSARWRQETRLRRVGRRLGPGRARGESASSCGRRAARAAGRSREQAVYCNARRSRPLRRCPAALGVAVCTGPTRQPSETRACQAPRLPLAKTTCAHSQEKGKKGGRFVCDMWPPTRSGPCRREATRLV